jgi:hypothetical protein
MAVDGVGGLTGGGDRLNGVDRHPVDGGIEVGDPEPNGPADADERDESTHAPVEELAGTDAEIFAGFIFGEQATFSGVGVCLHFTNRAVSTERRVLHNTRRYANLWVTGLLIRINERQGHGSEFSFRNEKRLSGQTFAGTWRFVVPERELPTTGTTYSQIFLPA